jgi:acetaldehyde dehydrogenase/alcohol dehydrogenase
VEEKVANLVAATERLLDRLEVPRSIAALGISKPQFELAMPDLAKVAFDDPSWRSNPRMPLVEELVELYWLAYRGRGADEKAADVESHAAKEEAFV